MEVLLNLAWAASAIALVTFWLRAGSRPDCARRRQIVAIAILIAILFPVISVSDDLMAIQCPSETNNTLRRDNFAHPDAHPHLPAGVMAPPPVYAGIAYGFLRYVSPAWAIAPSVRASLLSAIQNRPPPQA